MTCRPADATRTIVQLSFERLFDNLELGEMALLPPGGSCELTLSDLDDESVLGRDNGSFCDVDQRWVKYIG